MEIELPLADCSQNLDIFGMITRKDVDTGDISLMRCLPWDISAHPIKGVGGEVEDHSKASGLELR